MFASDYSRYKNALWICKLDIFYFNTLFYIQAESEVLAMDTALLLFLSLINNNNNNNSIETLYYSWTDKSKLRFFCNL